MLLSLRLARDCGRRALKPLAAVWHPPIRSQQQIFGFYSATGAALRRRETVGRGRPDDREVNHPSHSPASAAGIGMSGTEELMNADAVEEEGGEGEAQEDYEVDMDDPEVAQMQKQLEKAEQQKAELDKLNKMQGGAASADKAAADNAERDARSIFIGNVDFACSVEEVQELFRDCGEINAITIPVDKHTGRAKGFAYLEFTDKASVLAALEKNNAVLRDRAIKVVNKRTNLPIWQVHPTRGGRGMARGRGRGFPPPFRGRGGYRGGFRGYGRGHYHPYG